MEEIEINILVERIAELEKRVAELEKAQEQPLVKIVDNYLAEQHGNIIRHQIENIKTAKAVTIISICAGVFSIFITIALLFKLF